MNESWQDGKTVIECNEYMMENDIRTDMVFLVSNRARIGVKTFTEVIEDVSEEIAADNGSQEGDGSNEEDMEQDYDVDAPLNPKALPKLGQNVGKRNMQPINIEPVEIKAHSYVLSSRSVYFANEVDGGLPRNGPLKLIIEDVEPKAFKEILRYLYTDKFAKTKDLIMFILYGAKKFKIPALVKECIEYINSFLVEDIVPDELLMIMDYSEFFTEDTLLEKCRRWIVRHSGEALKSENFCKISPATLSHVLQANHFNCEELEIFLACKRWAEFQCKKQRKLAISGNIRQVLGDSLRLIHFPAIPLGDFVEHVSTSEILDICEEEVKVLRYLGRKIDTTHYFEGGIPFKFNNRCYADIGQQTILQNHDDRDLICHNIQMENEESKILEVQIEIEAEIPSIITSVVIYNQEEGEFETGGQGEDDPVVKNNYASNIEVEVEGLYAKAVPAKSQPKAGQAKLDLGENIRLEARKKYKMNIKYTFNVPPNAKPVPFFGDAVQHFSDSFNKISFYKKEKMMPFVEVTYKTY